MGHGMWQACPHVLIPLPETTPPASPPRLQYKAVEELGLLVDADDQVREWGVWVEWAVPYH